MPGNTQGMFYSYNLGLAHIISISTEAFYYPQYGNDSIKTQYNWLLDDLKVRIVTLCLSCVNFENKISLFLIAGLFAKCGSDRKGVGHIYPC
mgnify:CR=1 FL=1